MDFVDLQRRRKEERARQKPETPRRNVARDPFLLVGTGFVLGSAVSYFYSNVLYTPGISTLILLAAMITLICYFVRLLPRGDSAKTGAKLGSEKQLLMAIQDADGTITPIEAALETSLTVDEAEEILTRFAERGHLRVESQDGTLLYTLPGRRHTPEPRTI